MTKIGKQLLLTTAVAMLGLQGFSYAKNQDVAIVDMQQIEAKAVVVNDLIQKLQKEQSSLQEHINTKSKDLQRKARELESKRSVLSASAIEEQRKTLENSLINLQNEAQIKNEAIQHARTEGLSLIDQSMRDIIAKIAKKGKYKAVVATQVVLFVDKSEFDDVTEKVIADMNSSIKTVDVSKHLKDPKTSSKKK